MIFNLTEIKTIEKFFFQTTQFSFSNGFITPFNNQENISINDRFFLGGPLNLRGFNNRGAGPHKEGLIKKYMIC